jgi:hypothetical protein
LGCVSAIVESIEVADGDRRLAVFDANNYVCAIVDWKIRRQVHASAVFFWFVH